MGDAEDTVEFIKEQEKYSPDDSGGKQVNATPRIDFDGFDVDDDDPPIVEHFCQYSRLGHGFIPVGATLAKLDPGVYAIEPINNTMCFVVRKIVTDQLLRLPDSRSDEVIEDIKKFWSFEPRFKELGFTYKRGFILYGPQGGGKTSTIEIVMQQVVADGNIVIMGNSHPGVLQNMLHKFRQVEPERRIVVVIEDVDAIIDAYGESDVLALLDGEDSIDKVVYIATTNYPQKLPPRLANRPSRFDKIVKIGMPDNDARRMYLDSRKLGLTEQEMDYWIHKTKGFSIAHLKELIISVQCYEIPVDEVIVRLRAMAQIPTDDGDRAVAGFNVPV